MALAGDQDGLQSDSEQGRDVVETVPLLWLPGVEELPRGPCAIKVLFTLEAWVLLLLES